MRRNRDGVLLAVKMTLLLSGRRGCGWWVVAWANGNHP